MIGWQPIDTIPKDGTEILIVGRRGVMFLVMWNDVQWTDGSGMKFRMADYTHWMHLPEPPAKEQ